MGRFGKWARGATLGGNHAAEQHGGHACDMFRRGGRLSRLEAQGFWGEPQILSRTGRTWASSISGIWPLVEGSRGALDESVSLSPNVSGWT